MSDESKRDPAAAWQSLEDMALEAELADIRAQSREARRKAMRDEGFDPAKARQVGQELIEKAAREAGIAPPQSESRAPAPVIPLPTKKTSRIPRSVWIGVTAAAAAIALVVGGVTLMQPSNVVSSPSEHAAKLRTKALDECKHEQWTECRRDLDEAKSLDPEGEDRDDVKEVRRMLDEHR